MTILSIKILHAPRAYLKTLVLGLWAGLNPQRHSFSTFQLRWTRWLSQNFDLMCLGKWWAWKRGWLTSNHFHFRLSKGTLAPSISNLKCPFRSPYDNFFYTKCPGLKRNCTLCQHRSLLRQRYCAAYDFIIVTYAAVIRMMIICQLFIYIQN